MNEHEKIARGQRARAILDDPVQNEAWDAVLAKLRNIMENARTDEASLRARQAIHLLNDVRAYWVRVINEGTITAKQIELEKEETQRKWWQRAA